MQRKTFDANQMFQILCTIDVRFKSIFNWTPFELLQLFSLTALSFTVSLQGYLNRISIKLS